MDTADRSHRYLFWRKIFISLIAIGLVYILIIRPIQSILIQHLIFPFFNLFIKPESAISAGAGVDEFFIYSLKNEFSEVKIEIPFNGYFWLAMAMIWPSKNIRYGRMIWFYNWALFIIIPLIAMAMLQGYTWVAILAKLHERAYKAIFLIIGIIAIRDADRLTS